MSYVFEMKVGKYTYYITIRKRSDSERKKGYR